MKQILVIGAVVILIILGVYFFMQDDNAGETTLDENGTTEETNGTNDDTNGSSAGTNNGGNNTGDQTQNSVILSENETGNFATVGSARLTAPGFVVVYKVNSNGMTTYMGESNLLAAGTHTNLSIQLNSIVAEEETIVAILHADNGDGEFEVGNDTYLGNGSSPIVSDVDVVEVPFADEDDTLQAQVEAYLEASLEEDVEVQ